jgi:hypothetical protein
VALSTLLFTSEELVGVEVSSKVVLGLELSSVLLDVGLLSKELVTEDPEPPAAIYGQGLQSG